MEAGGVTWRKSFIGVVQKDGESSWLSRVIWFSKLHSDEHTRVSTGCMAAEGRLYLVKPDTRLSSKWVSSLVDWIEKCTQVINLALKTFKYKWRNLNCLNWHYMINWVTFSWCWFRGVGWGGSGLLLSCAPWWSPPSAKCAAEFLMEANWKRWWDESSQKRYSFPAFPKLLPLLLLLWEQRVNLTEKSFSSLVCKTVAIQVRG